MIFLLNTERVLLEIMELARLRISQESGVALDQIEARLEAIEHKIIPTFKLAGEIAGALEKSYTEQLMRDVWRGVQIEMVERLRGLLEVRHGCSKPKEVKENTFYPSRAHRTEP
jgi:hypothetical protein